MLQQQQHFPRIYISFPLFLQWPSRFCMAKKLKYVWCNDIFTSVLHKELIARLTQSQIQYFILYYHHLDHQICVFKGSSLKDVGTFLAIFDPLLHYFGIFYLINVDKKLTCLDYLPTCKFLTMSTEFDKNSSKWSYYSTDHKNYIKNIFEHFNRSY